jgi:hypothetical protein
VGIQAGWGVYTPIESEYPVYVECETADFVLTIENLPDWLAVVPRGADDMRNVVRDTVDGFAVPSVEDDRSTLKVGDDVVITRICGLNKTVEGVTYYRVVVGYNDALTSEENQESGRCVTVIDEKDNVQKIVLRAIGQLADKLEDGRNAYKVSLPVGYGERLLGRLPMERK